MQEFDVISFATISARGRFIEYTAIQQADGALRNGSAEIQIKADGVMVGRLLPGETLTLEKAATRWEITATNYARVRIGMGAADHVGTRGITTVATDNKTLRGLTFMGAAFKQAAAGFAYVGINNQTVDKIISVTAFSIGCGPSAAADVELCIGAPINHALDSQVVPKHPDATVPAGLVMVNGETAAAAVNQVTEIAQSWTITDYLLTNVQRQTTYASLEEPIMVTPGKALIVRNLVAARSVRCFVAFSMLDYGPR